MSGARDPTGRDLRQRVLEGETTFGCWLTLASPVTADLVGGAGYDWVLIDLEHGVGTETEALAQLQALAATQAVPLVRVESMARQRIGRVLDLGAEGVMVPRIENADEARRAALGLRYPPDGDRGVAKGVRVTGFGVDFDRYRGWASSGILGVVQVETASIMSDLGEVAAVDGVDVLFVGPNDLSAALGAFDEMDHPRYLEALEAVVEACRTHGKSPGILMQRPEDFTTYHDMGFRFLACGSDAGFVATGARETVAALKSSLTGEPLS